MVGGMLPWKRWFCAGKYSCSRTGLQRISQKPMSHLSSQKSEMKHIPHWGHINIKPPYEYWSPQQPCISDLCAPTLEAIYKLEMTTYKKFNRYQRWSCQFETVLSV
jgi:hypothetical protein